MIKTRRIFLLSPLIWFYFPLQVVVTYILPSPLTVGLISLCLNPSCFCNCVTVISIATSTSFIKVLMLLLEYMLLFEPTEPYHDHHFCQL